MWVTMTFSMASTMFSVVFSSWYAASPTRMMHSRNSNRCRARAKLTLLSALFLSSSTLAAMKMVCRSLALQSGATSTSPTCMVKSPHAFICVHTHSHTHSHTHATQPHIAAIA